MEGLNTKKAWLFLLPVLILMAVFTFYPLFHTVILSFLNDYNGMDAAGGETFEVGINNYIKLFNGSATSKKFVNALMVTSILVVITVPLSLIFALLIAVALNSIKPLKKLFQTLYFLPYVTNTLAVGAVFAVMFQYPGSGTTGVTGIMNSILKLFGIPAVNWIGAGSELWANIVVMVIYIVWNALPFKILIFMGALNSLNTQYYDAAKVDGASKFRIFRKITVPLLSPYISYLLITGFIGAFKEYTSIVGIFGETMGPAGDSGRMNTVVGRIYDFTTKSDYGYAAAMAIVLFLIILVLTMIQGYINKKRVHF